MATSFASEHGAAVIELIPPSSIEAQDRAAIDMQIATAKRWPMHSTTQQLEKVKEKIVAFSTLDEETAQSCYYTLKRKDKETGETKLIQGPSVRLAEIAVSCYGNLRVGARILENDGKKIKSQGVCLDLETNVCVSMETHRSIVTRKGHTFSEDMQVVVSNAANAISYRNAVFKVVPGALIKPAFEAAKKKAIGSGPIAGRWSKALTAFSGFGVNERQLLDLLDKHSATDIKDEDIGHLIGVYNAIRDGETTVEETFSGSAEAAKTTLEQKLQQETAQPTSGTETAPAATNANPAQNDSDTGAAAVASGIVDPETGDAPKSNAAPTTGTLFQDPGDAKPTRRGAGRRSFD